MEKNECLKSQYFYSYNIFGLQYFLNIYPNGNAKTNDEKTWIFLQINGASIERKIKAKFKFFIESANFETQNIEYIYERNNYGWGEYICKSNELFDYSKKFFINGKLIVKVKGIFAVESSPTSVYFFFF